MAEMTEKQWLSGVQSSIIKELTTHKAALPAGFNKEAANGNVNAAKFLRDTAGQNPAQQLQEKEFAYRKKQDREAKKAEENFGMDGGTPVEIYLPEKEDEDDE